MIIPITPTGISDPKNASIADLGIPAYGCGRKNRRPYKTRIPHEFKERGHLPASTFIMPFSNPKFPLTEENLPDQSGKVRPCPLIPGQELTSVTTARSLSSPVQPLATVFFCRHFCTSEMQQSTLPRETAKG